MYTKSVSKFGNTFGIQGLESSEQLLLDKLIHNFINCQPSISGENFSGDCEIPLVY